MTNCSPTYEHANHMRRLSQTHLDEHDTKLRRRSGSWSGSNTEHPYSPESSPPRSNSHFLSRFIVSNTDPYHRPLPKCPPEEAGFAYNPSERTAEQLKRKKGPLKGIGSFFRRFRQIPDTLAYSKSDIQEPCTNITDLQATQQHILKEEHLMHSNLTEHSLAEPWSMETAPERSKRESLQAHLKYFGLDLSSLPTSSEHITTSCNPALERNHMESLRAKPHGRFEMARSIAEDMPIQEENEFDIAKSGISSSDASCQTSESMYNTYANSQQKLPYSPVSLTHEFEPNQAHDNDQLVPVEELKDEFVDYDDYDDGVMRIDNGKDEYHAHGERRTDMLTKRLSGGHFGSAGGLVTSVSDFLARPLPSSAKRHSTSSMESVKKEDTVTSFRGERRSSKNSAHTVVGVIVPPLDLPPPPPIRIKSPEPQPELIVDDKIANLDAEVASINNLKHAIEDLPSPEETVSEVSEESDDKDAEEKNAKLAARRIWVEDETFLKDMERVAEWLGSRQLRLDVAFRKLPLNAETQQIDRILETFAIRYWECNLNSIFGNADVVYAIVYSILLLNTDLHVAQGEHKKMSRSAFIRNTMCAIRAQVNMFNDTATRSNPMAQFVGTKMWYSDIESILKEMYTAVKNAQISQPSVTPSKTSSGSATFDGTSISNFSFSRSNGNPLRRPTTSKISLERSSNPDLTRISGRHARKQMSIRSHSSASSRSRCESVASFQSSSGSYGSSSEPTSVAQYQSIAALITNTNLAASYMSDAPFYKEGVIFGKHLLEIADQKAKGREWKEYFCSVHQAELLIHRMDHRGVDRKAISKSSNASQSSLSVTDSSFSWQSSTVVVGGGDQRSQSQQMICIDLKHSLSNTLPSGYSRRRPHAFALQQADGGVYVFSVGSDEQVAAWTSTLNYWAARESKEPLIGGVGNMEFGWGECLQDVIGTPDRYKIRPGAKPVNINEWRPPVPPGMNSNLSETEQYANLQRHIESLNKDLDGHREIKAKMSNRFSPRTTAYIKALSNWEAKQQYLLHEIIKYQNYCDAIEKALAIQAEAQLTAK
ncbi:hypothetical protein NQZ79_g4873 [Umbelopsis isabellina]|nr:hypothetical protein NQZ79_g4873 [Umbelopsis isabellina]